MFIFPETIEEFKEDVGLPGSSKEIVYDDPMFPPVKKIFKSKIDQKWLQKERTSFRSVIKFNEKLEQLKENGEFEIRIQRLIKYLNIETSHRSYQGYHVESTGYEEIIQRVDYLDCSGLHFSTAEKKTSFKPFSQSSVDDFLGWMAVFDKVFRKTRSPKCRLILSILFSACTKETLLKFNPRHLSLIIHKCLDYAIENQNHIFLVELVRSYIFQFDFHLDKLFRGKKVNFVVIDTFLTAAKFMILRECPRLPQNSIKLSFCYECRKEKRLVMMVSYKDSIDMKDGLPNSAMGLKLVFYNYTEPSEEASTVFNSFQASCLSQQMPIIAEKDARKLFKEHSNLTQISTSPFKSTGYSRGKHRVVQKQCISLLCLHKGYIPLGEREFPKEIHGFEVDIQEGYCSLGRGRSVDAGGHIRRARGMNTPGCGSIGGFVDLTNDPQNPNRHTAGLITCAHVVFSSDELKIPRNELIHILDKDTDFEVEVFDKNQHEFKVCGRIVDACFSALVDAALIQLDPTVSDFQFRATSAEQLLTAGFDPNKPPVFNGKAVLDEDLLQSKIPRKLGSVVKYGSTTGFTIGNLYPNEVHINFVSENGDLPDKTQSVMYHQIEIQSLPHGTFFKPGDSGSFVFCINQDKTLSCLGMAIGSTTKGSCLVTPMVRILRSFDCCKTESLKPCPLNVDKNTSRASDNPSNAQHNSNTSQINLEAEIGSLKNTVKNLRRRVQSDSRNFKREIGNLKTEVEILRMQIQLETSRGNPNPS
ncbi:uncharacterized protein LOC134232216 [Saccostrea cucullata]|uniref:uncharacterized protein LOC134232216 n=1 Tax=Saccostrea cuccullata TaxID=36930 RepID=UPI002ED4AA50